jgi:hypothetical protein
MSTLLHAAALIEGAAATITTIWAALGEIVTAGALLLALDRLAAAIRTTYAAGRWCGGIWFRYGQPALLAAADGISWLLSQIDWAEVRATVAAGARVLIAAVVTLALTAHQLVIATSAAMGKRYAALLSADANAPITPATVQTHQALVVLAEAPAAPIPAATAPLQHPLTAVAAELEHLTHRQLQALTGCRRKSSKAQLITMAVAMA